MCHESFANNIIDLINGNELNLLKDLLYEINEKGVKEYKKYTIEEMNLPALKGGVSKIVV
jgi:hypothetical protein